MKRPETDIQIPGGASDQPAAGLEMETETTAVDVAYPPAESLAQMGEVERETAREVAAQHLARLMYAPVDTWSRYTFHETNPHPFGASRRERGRG